MDKGKPSEDDVLHILALLFSLLFTKGFLSCPLV